MMYKRKKKKKRKHYGKRKEAKRLRTCDTWEEIMGANPVSLIG